MLIPFSEGVVKNVAVQSFSEGVVSYFFKVLFCEPMFGLGWRALTRDISQQQVLKCEQGAMSHCSQ
jgi:putative component of membrane protein insertase Oxa1/YidC/SpoIIIJ protein YidD